MCRDSDAGLQNLAIQKDLFLEEGSILCFVFWKERKNCERGWTYIYERIADFIAKDRIYLFNLWNKYFIDVHYCFIY